MAFWKSVTIVHSSNGRLPAICHHIRVHIIALTAPRWMPTKASRTIRGRGWAVYALRTPVLSVHDGSAARRHGSLEGHVTQKGRAGAHGGCQRGVSGRGSGLGGRAMLPCYQMRMLLLHGGPWVTGMDGRGPGWLGSLWGLIHDSMVLHIIQHTSWGRGRLRPGSIVEREVVVTQVCWSSGIILVIMLFWKTNPTEKYLSTNLILQFIKFCL